MNQTDHLPNFDDLETLNKCPICLNSNTKLVHAHLSDRVFNTAGDWQMHQCLACNTMYLNPRYKKATIAKAYQSYYTHIVRPQPSINELPFVKKLVKLIANSYRNRTYGTKLPELKLGYMLVYLMYPLKISIDNQFRYIPKAATNGLLLDVGCGNGNFLKVAAEASWKAVGVDFDPMAVVSAKKNGFDATLGDLSVYDGSHEVFDVITLNHVIEHLHDPIEAINHAYRLLKPGGMLFMEFPNIESYGHLIYGEHWRGLEPPRHLILMTWSLMTKKLYEAGFIKVTARPHKLNFSNFSAKSRAIKNHRDPYQERSTLTDHLLNYALCCIQVLGYKRTECITLVAYK